MTLSFWLLVAAFIAFLLATLGAVIPRISLVPLGLALWVLATLIGAWS